MKKGRQESEARPKPTLMTKTTFVKMSEYLKALEKKLTEVRGGMREAAGRIGQWHDSFPFEEAQRQEGILMTQTSEMKRKLRLVEFIEPRCDVETVGIGNTVQLRFEGGEEEEFTILTPDDYNFGDNPSWIPFTSPIAQAIIGHKRGDSVAYEAKDGSQEVTILEIRPGEFE